MGIVFVKVLKSVVQNGVLTCTIDVSAENGYILYAAIQRKWFLVSLANDQTSFNTE